MLLDINQPTVEISMHPSRGGGMGGGGGGV